MNAGPFDITMTLVQMRLDVGMSQKELAQKLKTTQSWVAKFENRGDFQLKIGEIKRYVEVFGKTAKVEIK